MAGEAVEDEGRGDRDRLRGVRWLRRLPLSLCTTINYIVIVLCIAFAMCQPNGKRNSVEERRKERERERGKRERFKNVCILAPVGARTQWFTKNIQQRDAKCCCGGLCCWCRAEWRACGRRARRLFLVATSPCALRPANTPSIPYTSTHHSTIMRYRKLENGACYICAENAMLTANNWIMNSIMLLLFVGATSSGTGRARARGYGLIFCHGILLLLFCSCCCCCCCDHLILVGAPMCVCLCESRTRK